MFGHYKHVSFPGYAYRKDFLVAGSIATQSHTNSKPILSSVSSTTNSPTLFFLEETLVGLYFVPVPDVDMVSLDKV